MYESIIRAPLRKRCRAFWIDFLVYCIILSVVFTALFLLIFDFKAVVNSAADDERPIFLDSFKHFVVAIQISFFLFLLKDALNGKSIGKKIMGLAVRDSRDYNKTPNILILFLRNIFLILWPVELIIIFIDKKNQRLGDIILGATVVEIKDAP
jgi:uncharacterized RDD family membrane protein YckC